jgi:nicotinamide-nucleotide amidase
MMQTAFDVIHRLAGKTLATAESITAGGIGAALTAVPGASNVYKGGIISYCDEAKGNLLGVPAAYLTTYGAVSAQVAQVMAEGARKALHTDIAVSVTGLAGPTGDEFGHEVGTVFIGYADARGVKVEEHHFSGDREDIRHQTIETALLLLLKNA